MNNLSKLTVAIVTTVFCFAANSALPGEVVAQDSTGETIENEAPSTSTSTNNVEQLYKDLVALNRAKNLARMAAESANGGVNSYRAEPAMHGTPEESPFVDNNDGTWTFNFYGTIPGLSEPAFRTIVTVSKDGNMVRVDENNAL